MRAELTTAMNAGQQADLRFEVGPVELELSIVVEKSIAPGAKVRFWVVEAGADARAATATTQRIKLTLDPRKATDPTQRALISGAEVAGER
ncbi:trypco2 family protein [Fodinicola feengrottensis]|uniref:trypco2 family protein n=1 Tax=Fodinicola feengrottensis TaxID=435914 RepID=UPI002443657B|nr:trypco2 family protein [Fodinicola feengrottensis]